MNIICHILANFKTVVFEVPVDGTTVPKHVGVIKEYSVVCVVCAFSSFSKRK